MDTLQLAVSQDLGVGIVELQRAEQGDEGLALLGGAGVGRTALGVEASLVADADAVGIVVAGVGSGLLLAAALVQLAVAGDVVVVAALLPATGAVHLVEHLERDVLVGPTGRTVDDDEVDLSHFGN